MREDRVDPGTADRPAAKLEEGRKLFIGETNPDVNCASCHGKDGKGAAFAFFKPTVVEGNKLSGEPFIEGAVVKAPVLESCPAHLECRVTDVVKRGDHTVFVAEVVEANVKTQPAGRADDAILWMKDLGEKVFYGG